MALNELMASGYVDDYAIVLGRLMGNYANLERLLRAVLYELGHEPHTALPEGTWLVAVKPGDRLPLNAHTSWASLGRQLRQAT